MVNSIKIGILSDSHRKVDLTAIAINHLKDQGASYLVHAGDLEVEENMKLLKDSKLPYTSVFGNNDYSLVSIANKYNIHKEPYHFKIEDSTFKLMHLPFYLTPDSNIVISGHTHIFEHSYINNTLFLNPGEICAREKNRSECVILEIQDDKYIITYYFRDPTEDNWESEEFIYAK